jgi:RES domain-containing protein
MKSYRIGDVSGAHPIYSGQGAALTEGRWHEKGQDVIYSSEHYSAAMLERLIYFNGIMPRGQRFVEISIPAGTTYEVVTKDILPDWHLRDGHVSRAFGSAWFVSLRSALLIVPSRVAREERNVLINPHHPDAKAISPSLEMPVCWDERLFASIP